MAQLAGAGLRNGLAAVALGSVSTEHQITLEPMTHGEARSFLARSLSRLVEDLVELNGWDETQALKRAKEMEKDVLPQHESTLGHEFRWITSDSHRVGEVWYGPMIDDETMLYLWDIRVGENHRGEGFGGAALGAVAKAAQDLQLKGVALTVLANNPNARRLYESKGYTVQSEEDDRALMTLQVAPPT